MKRWWLLTMLMTVLMFGCTLEKIDTSAINSVCLDETEWKLAELINEYRKDNGAGQLTTSVVLSSAAHEYSTLMAEADIVHHDLRHNDRNWYERILDHGYPTVVVAQDLAGGFTDPEQLLLGPHGWKYSPLHNASIIDPKYREMGIALIHVPYEERKTTHQRFWTLHLGDAETQEAVRC
jgi:uncharacterized protein YkwD